MRAAELDVWFLLKSLLVLAVVFLLASRGQSPEEQGPARAKVETARRGGPATQKGDAIETLKQAAAQKIAETMREQCLKRPEDCLSAVKTVGAGLSALDKAR